MRADVLEDLARRAVTDPEFPHRARGDLEATLSRYGYRLTADELRSVKDARRTAGMGPARPANPYLKKRRSL